MTPIELALSQKDPFEDNLSKFISNETIADDGESLLLEDTIRQVNMHEPYRETPLKVNVTDRIPRQNSETLTPPKQEEEMSMSEVLASVAELLSRFYLEQCKRLLNRCC